MHARRKVTLAALLACAVPLAAAASYRPIVMMHGMNSDHTSLNGLMAILRQKYPGIYVTSLPVYDGVASEFTNIRTQLNAVVKVVQNDSNLAHGFNFYGESQGALLARAYVTTVNDPPVYNLIAINGPQNGVGECPKVEVPGIKQLCGDLARDLQIYHWPLCAFCGYWRGKNEDVYLRNSEFIADVNCDRAANETRRNNMISLNKYMATVALRDEIVQPRESAWHAFWYWNDEARSKVMPYDETDGYRSDVLGLKTLDQRGDLILNSFDGAHCGYPMDWWMTNVLPMFDNQLPDESDAVVV